MSEDRHQSERYRARVWREFKRNRRAVWSLWIVLTLALFAVGLYGGAFQVGVGILLLFALSHGGLDLVRANAVKVQVIAAVTLVAVPVFAIEKQIAWLPAGFLAVGFTLGGALGVRLAVRGGEKLIRPVLALAVIALAGRMFGLL